MSPAPVIHHFYGVSPVSDSNDEFDVLVDGSADTPSSDTQKVIRREPYGSRVSVGERMSLDQSS